jgi:hypothetical protein
MEHKSKSLNTVIVIAVIALVLGGLGGYMIQKNKNDDNKVMNSSLQTPSTVTKAADLRTLLSGLEQEHVDLASAATRAGFDGTASFMPAAASLDKNSKDLAAAVGSVYGQAAGDKFYQIWNSHIGFFVDYTVAAKAGDQAGMDKAVKNLAGYVDAISTFFSDANPNLPKAAVAQLVGDHVALLKETVDSYGAGDIAGSFDKQRQARTQIGTKIADTISGAIVKQYPDKFQN